jgi:hypothetical protein
MPPRYRTFAKKMNPTIESAVIDDRLPVWEALSEFFLDTELEENDYQRISEVLATSPYSIQDIEDILRFEVYPVLIWNLRSVAGEWAGFDRDWLQEQIEPRLKKRPKFRMPMLPWGMIRDHWKHVSTTVRDKRKTKANNALF